MSGIERLQAALRTTDQQRPELKCDLGGMDVLAQELQAQFGVSRKPSPGLIDEAVKNYLLGNPIESFRTLKFLCYGLAVPVGKAGRAITGEPELLRRLLTEINQLRNDPKRFRRLYQGVLATYLELDPRQDGPMPDQAAFVQIREFLRDGLGMINNASGRPEWQRTLNVNTNLLEPNPVLRYAQEVLDGNRARFDALCKGLLIGKNSWVRREIVLAATHAACKEADNRFRSRIEPLTIALVDHPAVEIEGLIALLDRYALMQGAPDNPQLRDWALRILGNPLLTSNRPRWTRVSDGARRMVENWLKGRLIEQFFRELSKDGATDPRRLKFWRSYAASIDNVWFVLGRASMEARNHDLVELRKLMGDQALSLVGAGISNNAFIMKLGSVYAVEFSETGNAAYLYRETSVPFQLSGSLHISSDLKNRQRGEQFIHNDGRTVWEIKFANALQELAGIAPPEELRPYLR